MVAPDVVAEPFYTEPLNTDGRTAAEFLQAACQLRQEPLSRQIHSRGNRYQVALMWATAHEKLADTSSSTGLGVDPPKFCVRTG